jgi:hypothetical protein
MTRLETELAHPLQELHIISHLNKDFTPAPPHDLLPRAEDPWPIFRAAECGGPAPSRAAKVAS